jgi:O-antigen/teichoic acid export membrane protein
MLTIMTVPYDAVLNANENMLYFSIVGIIESLLKLLVAYFVLYTTSDKLIIYGFLMASISFVIMIMMRTYCHRKYKQCIFGPKKYFDKHLMREMSKFAGFNFNRGSCKSYLLPCLGTGFISWRSNQIEKEIRLAINIVWLGL